MKLWRRLQRARRKTKNKPRRRLTKSQILALHEQYLDSILDWNPNALCHWCQKPFGKQFSPVTNSGFWFHYPCCGKFLELQQLQSLKKVS